MSEIMRYYHEYTTTNAGKIWSTLTDCAGFQDGELNSINSQTQVSTQNSHRKKFHSNICNSVLKGKPFEKANTYFH